MASCKGPILAALIYILSTAPAKSFRFAFPKKGNESWAGLMLFCFFFLVVAHDVAVVAFVAAYSIAVLLEAGRVEGDLH